MAICTTACVGKTGVEMEAMTGDKNHSPVRKKRKCLCQVNYFLLIDSIALKR